ncbi:MAG: hypothetical protein BWK76_27640 [Desulfobulbaceae bacterium A2]|nr:MAG: hypothetical protein BWK76_27640 [Desulfobulbaceae bacterium A2]
MRWLPVLSLFALLCHAATAHAAGGPIDIEADRMLSQEKENSVLFSGKVVAKQDDVTIFADEMTVYYAPEGDNQKKPAGAQKNTPPQKGPGGGGAQKIQKLICTGKVKITRGEWTGLGQRMDYFAGERKVVLSGDAQTWQGQNMVAGKTIIYYLDEGRSIVEQDDSTRKRVKAVLHPDSKAP